VVGVGFRAGLWATTSWGWIVDVLIAISAITMVTDAAATTVASTVMSDHTCLIF
jgi:hypothetical protein